MIKYIVMFTAAFLVDWVWAEYIKHTAAKNAWRSAGLSGVIVLIGAFTTFAYMEDRWMVAPALLGGMLGTYVSVKRS